MGCVVRTQIPPKHTIQNEWMGNHFIEKIFNDEIEDMAKRG